jgi:hypothetical protein
MRKIQLIEWGIIVVGLVFGYKFMESLFLLALQVIITFDIDIEARGYLWKSLLMAGLYAVGFVAIIRNSHKLASYLNGGAANDAIPLKIGRRSALQVVLIAICAMQIFAGIATVLIYLYETFAAEISKTPLYGHNARAGISKDEFRIEAVKVVIALIVICFSKDLANLFFRKNEPDELVLETKQEETDGGKHIL